MTWNVPSCSTSATMSSERTAQPQQYSQDRAKQVGTSIFKGRFWRPDRPEILPSAIKPELHSVIVCQMKKRTVQACPDFPDWLAAFIRVGTRVHNGLRLLCPPRLGGWRFA